MLLKATSPPGNFLPAGGSYGGTTSAAVWAGSAAAASLKTQNCHIADEASFLFAKKKT